MFRMNFSNMNDFITGDMKSVKFDFLDSFIISIYLLKLEHNMNKIFHTQQRHVQLTVVTT